MRGNILGILFTILSGVLIFLIGFAYTRSDRQEPEFRFSAVDLTYDSRTTDKDLKMGINAFDAKDGDLTNRIVVEKVVLNRDKSTAVVYYAVADFAGNVTKQSRVFPADISDIDNNGDSSDIIEEGLFPSSRSCEDENGLEEERRLAYVGMTRAMRKLFLTYAASRFSFGSRNYNMPSRFLMELGYNPYGSAGYRDEDGDGFTDDFSEDEFDPFPEDVPVFE